MLMFSSKYLNASQKNLLISRAYVRHPYSSPNICLIRRLYASKVALKLKSNGERKMKRKATDATSPKAKRQAVEEPDYCDIALIKDNDGFVWPAARRAMQGAKSFIQEAAASKSKVLIVPDKDADGLSSGVIVWRTLCKLGLDDSSLGVHLVSKGTSIHDESQRAAMQAKEPAYIIVVDQGSRGGPRVIDNPNTKALIIDHHLSDEFPKDAIVVSACHYPPVATSALLTYEICKDLHPDIEAECAYLCAIGTAGDLGTTLKWKPPFPDMTAVWKQHTKKAISEAVSLINAARRTPEYKPHVAWEALLASSGPRDLESSGALLDARAKIKAEVERNTHAPPKFSKDGKIAVLRITSPAQVHPVIATRWAGHLKSRMLEIVMVANDGYLPGMVNFSCWVARCARGREPAVNIIETLKAVAALDEGDLVARMGESFARGHKEASGGIIPVAEFEELMALIKLGEKPDKVEGDSPAKKKKAAPVQKNKLDSYFAAK